MFDGLSWRGNLTAAIVLAATGLSACSQPVVQDSPAGARDATVRAADPTSSARGRTSGATTVQADTAARTAARARRDGAFLQASATGDAARGSDPAPVAQGSAWSQPDSASALRPHRYLTERSGRRNITEIPTAGIAAGEETTLLAAAAAGAANAAKSAQCAALERDINADLGEVLRAGCQPSLAQMSALMDNPLGNVAMLFTQFDLYRMENPVNGKSANKWNYMGIAQFPKAISKDWNLINRIVWNVPSMPLDQDKIDRAADRAQRVIGSGNAGGVLPPAIGGVAPIDLFEGRTTSFGDMYYNGLFAPKEGIDMGAGKFLWGAGFDLGIPTATEDILGTGKWLAGPSALGVYMGPKWKVGALVQHFWDFAGDDDRDDVNLTNLQYFIFYSLDDTTSIGAAPNIIANWEQDSDNAFTVPIGLGISKTVQFGKVPVRFGVEFHYNVVKPDDVVGSEWDFRFYVIPAAPSALFEWMTRPLFGG